MCKFVVFCCIEFRGKLFIFKDIMHWHTVEKFSRNLKTNKNFFGNTWTAQSLELSVTQNVCIAIKLKLHVETDVIKTRAKLANAARRIWRALFI